MSLFCQPFACTFYNKTAFVWTFGFQVYCLVISRVVYSSSSCNSTSRRTRIEEDRFADRCCRRRLPRVNRNSRASGVPTQRLIPTSRPLAPCQQTRRCVRLSIAAQLPGPSLEFVVPWRQQSLRDLRLLSICGTRPLTRSAWDAISHHVPVYSTIIDQISRTPTMPNRSSRMLPRVIESLCP